MRILIWSETYWPYLGGVERFLTRLAPGLRDCGHDVRVLTAHGHLSLPDNDEFEGIPVRRIDLFRTLRERRPDALLELKRGVAGIVSSFQPDVIHVNLQGPGVLLFARAAADCALVITIHVTLESLQTAGSDTILGRALQQAQWVTVCSRVALDRLLALSPSVRAISSVIPIGIDIPILPPRPPRPAAGVPPRLLFVGRLVPMKGVDLAIDAVARLRSSFPTLRLTVVGDGSERGGLEAQARAAGLASVVDFVGWQSAPQVAALMEQATLVVMPSRATRTEYTEGLGLVALEAAALGRAVVAARVGGIPEAVADGVTGLLVEGDDASALAEAIGALLADPDRAVAMGHAGRQRAIRHFGWTSCFDAFHELFSRLSAEGRRVR